MEEDKKAFLLYIDSLEILNDLDDHQIANLFKAILAFVKKEESPELSQIEKIAFLPIKNYLKRDAESWIESFEVRSRAGKVGAEARWKGHTKLQNANRKNRNAVDGKNALSVSVNVNVNIYNQFIEKINQILKKNYRGDERSKKQFNARLKDGYKLEDLVQAVTNASNDPYHKENNYKYINPEFITRSDKLDKFLNMNGEYPVEKNTDSSNAYFSS